MKGSRDFRGLAWLFAVLTTGCASTGFVPRPFPTPTGSAALAPPAPVDAPTPAVTAPDPYALVGTALNLRGTPYRNGGSDPSGFDCSGFTQYVFAQHGIALPRAVEEQFQVGRDVKPADLTSGDLVFFSTVSRGASHVGIAIGGDEFVHAPSSTGVVRVEHLSSSYWSQRFLAAKRLH
jgi:cell wall-associated NlpC family hydrolase